MLIRGTLPLKSSERQMAICGEIKSPLIAKPTMIGIIVFNDRMILFSTH